MFTPLRFSVDGMLGGEAEVFLKRLGDGPAMKWGKSYSEVMGWLRARLSFAIQCASVLCFRRSHTNWRTLVLEDGTAIGLTMV